VVLINRKTFWRIFAIFSICVVFICWLVFITSYNVAYDDDTYGGWLAPSDGVIIKHLFIISISIISSIVIKYIFKEKTNFLLLIACSIILPIICYNSNHYLFAKNNLLYPLVDKGGPFYFIVNGDYNFDGINDKDYSIDNDERKCENGYGGHFNDKIIKKLILTSTGTGKRLELCYPSYNWENQIIELHIETTDINLKELELNVSFNDPSTAESTKFYLYDTDGLLLEHKANKDGSVSIIFDTETCQSWQRNSNGNCVELPIKYVVTY